MRIPFRIAGLALGLTVAASPAHAVVSMYTPVTGSDFVEMNAVFPSGVYRASGYVGNSSTTNAGFVRASLGKSSGGANQGFTVFGIGNGLTTTCTVVAKLGNTDSAPFTFSNSSSAALQYSMFINTNLPSGGEWFYSIECTLPIVNPNVGTSARIYGVKPNH